MSSTKARGELISITDTVNLTAQFYDNLGQPADTDSFPTISIVQPSGLIYLVASSAGVQRLGVGLYMYQFEVPLGGMLGVWQDLWQGSISGTVETQTLSFIVFASDLAGLEINDGYEQLGQDPGFDYSQTAIKNINKLLKALRARLNSRGKTETIDQFGNKVFTDCDIFSMDQLVTFLGTALSMINSTPYFTAFTFNDTDAINLIFDLIIEGATLYALASQALIERGREFTISDNGINLNIPLVSEILNSQFSAIYTVHIERVKYTKNSMRPSPRSLGLLSTGNSAINPVIKNLSRLRARRIF